MDRTRLHRSLSKVATRGKHRLPRSLSLIEAVAALALLLVANPDLAFAHRPAGAGSSAPQPQAPGPVSDLDGELEILHEDTTAGGHYRYFLHSGGVRYALQFPGKAPENLATGAKLRVRGVRSGATMAVGGDSTAVQQLAPAPAPNTLGEQRTLVMLVNFHDSPTEPYTLDHARGVIFGTTSDFFAENSYRQTWLSGDVVGWYTIPVLSTVCDTASVEAYAKSAALAAGVDPAAYARLVYAFPRNACQWWGLASVGGNPSRAHINGDLKLDVVAHELGHGLGLFHSNALDCGVVADGTTCTSIEYGDFFDIMGTTYPGHFNAFQKERLGWLNAGASPPITTVVVGGTYTIDTYETPGPAPKALKVLRSIDPSTGKRTWYYVESRRAVGFDTFLMNIAPNVTRGILVHRGSESSPNSSYLLDMNPADDISIWDWLDNAPLLAGQIFHDPDRTVTITTDWVGDSQAAVTVTFAPSAAGQTSMSLTTDRTTYSRNQSVSIKAIVRSGITPVVNATVTFTIRTATGDTAITTARTGTDGVAVQTVRLKRQDPIGLYQVRALATKSTLSTTAETSFLVQ